jgi:hypothetical protein
MDFGVTIPTDDIGGQDNQLENKKARKLAARRAKFWAHLQARFSRIYFAPAS